MAKRVQEQREEETIVAKSRPTAMNLCSRVVSRSRLAALNLSSSIATSSSTASRPIVSESPGMPIASGKPDSRMRTTNSFEAVWTSQVQLKDAYLGGIMEEQRRNPSHREEKDSEDSDNPEDEMWYHKGK